MIFALIPLAFDHQLGTCAGFSAFVRLGPVTKTAKTKVWKQVSKEMNRLLNLHLNQARQQLPVLIQVATAERFRREAGPFVRIAQLVHALGAAPPQHSLKLPNEEGPQILARLPDRLLIGTPQLRFCHHQQKKTESQNDNKSPQLLETFHTQNFDIIDSLHPAQRAGIYHPN